MDKKKAFSFLKHNKTIIFVMLLVLIARLALFFGYHELWWDSGVYIGMGKYLFSLGNSGLWEHIRPVLWPATLGFLWSLKLSPVFFGRLLELAFSLGTVYLSYLVASRYFGEKSAVIASVLVAFSSIFFFMGFRLYSEIPSVFFALLAVYLFTEEKHYFAGLSAGLAFASKFPAGIFIICLGTALLFLRPGFKKYSYLSAGFATVIVPYLFLNHAISGSSIGPFLEAGRVIRQVIGCNVLRYHPAYYYLYLPLVDNFFNIFALAGLYYYFKKFAKKNLLPFLCLLLPFLYFTSLHCRDSRYFLLFMPFLAMFSGHGIYTLFDRFYKGKDKKAVFAFLVLAIVAISFSFSISYYEDNERKYPNEAEEGYLRFLQGKEAEKEVWSSNPAVSAYTDLPISKIYYPVYIGGVARYFNSYLYENSNSISYVLLDNCGGGIMCAEGDFICMEQTESILHFLEKHEPVYNTTLGRCYYRIYKIS